MSQQHPWLEYAKRVQALAQAGITYAENDYDLERYQELSEISRRLRPHGSRGHPSHRRLKACPGRVVRARRGVGRLDGFEPLEIPFSIDRRHAAGSRGRHGLTVDVILNVAGSGKFSSDRTISEYAKEIWDVPACPVT